MAFRDSYTKQVELLLRALPHVAEEKVFALKGGAAINLFVRNFPRLSVDLDAFADERRRQSTSQDAAAAIG